MNVFMSGKIIIILYNRLIIVYFECFSFDFYDYVFSKNR